MKGAAHLVTMEPAPASAWAPTLVGLLMVLASAGVSAESGSDGRQVLACSTEDVPCPLLCMPNFDYTVVSIGSGGASESCAGAHCTTSNGHCTATGSSNGLFIGECALDEGASGTAICFATPSET